MAPTFCIWDFAPTPGRPGPGRGSAARAMAAVVPTAAEVRKQACGRPKIVEALQLLGVDAHHKTGAKALKAHLLQLMPTGHAGPTTVGRHHLLCALVARPARAFAARRAGLSEADR